MHGGKWVFARVEVGAARMKVGSGQRIWGDCGEFSKQRGHFEAVFQGNRPEKRCVVEKWAAVSAQWPGTGGFSEGSSDVVSCRLFLSCQASVSGVFLREGFPFNCLAVRVLSIFWM